MATYKIAGTVYGSDGNPAQRQVALLDRTSLSIVDSGSSDPITGIFELNTTSSDPVLVLVMPGLAENSNARVYDRVTPILVEP